MPNRISVYFALIFILVLPSLFFLPENLHGIYSFTSNLDNPYAGNEVKSLKELFLVLGIYGLGNLPPYSSVSIFPLEASMISVVLMLAILIVGLKALIGKIRSDKIKSSFIEISLLFVFVILALNVGFLMLYARNQTYTYAKASYYIFPIILFALLFSLATFHRDLIIPAVIFLIISLVPTSSTFINSITEGGERSSIANLGLVEKLSAIPRDAYVYFIPNKFSSAHIAIREVYLYNTRVTMLQGRNAELGTIFDFEGSEVFFVEDTKNGILMEKFSCYSTTCEMKLFIPRRELSPNVLVDFNHKRATIVSKN